MKSKSRRRYGAGGTLPLLEFLEGFDGLGTEDEDGDDGDPGHEAYANVAELPDQICLADGAEDDGSQQNHLEEAHAEALPPGIAVVEEIEDAGFGIEIIGHDGAEHEEDHGHGDELAAEAGKHRIHGALRIAGVIVSQLRGIGNQHVAGAVQDVVGARRKNHQGRGRAHQKRIDIDRKRLGQTLLRRVVHIGRSRNDGAGPLPRLIGEDASLDTHGDGGTDDAARNGVDPESAPEDGPEHRRDFGPVIDDHHQRHEDVAEGHEGRDDGCHLGDALHPADDHDTHEDGQADSRCQRRHRESVLQGHGSPVGLHRHKEKAAADERDDCKGHPQPALPEALFNEAERTAAIAGSMRKLIDLRQRGLHEGG